MRQAFLEIRGMSYVFCWCKAVFFEPRLRADLYWVPPWNAMKMYDLEIEFVD
jgi:hypothetical protein